MEEVAQWPRLTHGFHLQLILDVVREPEELLLSFGLARGVAGKQPLRARAAARFPNPLCLRPGSRRTAS